MIGKAIFHNKIIEKLHQKNDGQAGQALLPKIEVQ